MIAGMRLALPGCLVAMQQLGFQKADFHTSREDVVTPIWQDWSVICHMSLKLEADQMKV